MKVVVWGIGNHWNKVRHFLDWNKIEIVAFVDNNPRLESIMVNHCEVCVRKPEFLLECRYECILIASIYVDSIKQQILGMGIPEQQIVEDVFSSAFMDNTKIILHAKALLEHGQSKIKKELEEIKVQNGRIWSNSIKSMDKIENLSEVGFKVFSQWDEDGIIQWLIQRVPIKNKTFIEFGVEDYTEANTRFLLLNNNWSGMIIDGSRENIDRVISSHIMWEHSLHAVAQFITKDNINELLSRSGFEHDLGLLSIDIDGNDYWVLKEIEMEPRILILEYNAIWGGIKKVTIPYREDFYRTDAHYSNLYWGMSFMAARQIAEEKGYVYIGSNYQNSNAFFVRKDLAGFIDMSNMDVTWRESRFRESRDEQGRLTHLDLLTGLRLIRDMEIYDIDTKSVKQVSEEYGV